MDDDDSLERIEPTVIPSADDVAAEALASASFDFDTSMRTKFSAEEYRVLRTIGAFIMRGMSLRESCVLARVLPEKLEVIMIANEDVRMFIEFKQTAYKAVLLGTLSGAATAGQVKSAGYLLENQFRSDFGKKTAGDADRQPDAFEQAINFIRERAELPPGK